MRHDTAGRVGAELGDPIRAARPLVGEIDGLRERFRAAGLTRVVLVSDPLTGLAAEALVAAAGLPPTRLAVLDSPDPGRVGEVLAGDLDATVLVVADEGDARSTTARSTMTLLHETVAAAMRAAGHDPAARTVLVRGVRDGSCGQRPDTDPPSAHGPPGPEGDTDRPGAETVVQGRGGRGLTALALVPAGLAGADPGAVLAEAAAARTVAVGDSLDNPALELGIRLARARTVALVDDGTGLAGWVALAVATATGPHGPRPVVLECVGAPGWDGSDLAVAVVTATGAVPDRDAPLGTGGRIVARRTVGGPGAQLVLWSQAAAIAATLLPGPALSGVAAPGPVHHSETGKIGIAAGAAPPVPSTGPSGCDGAVEVFAGPCLEAGRDAGPGAGIDTVLGALQALIAGSPEDAPLTLSAHLDSEGDASLAVLRAEIARRTGRPTAFAFAPRCPPAAGGLCQLTGAPDPGSATPDAVDALIAAQAARVRDEAAGAVGPVLRLHLLDRVVGLVTVARAVQEL